MKELEEQLKVVSSDIYLDTISKKCFPVPFSNSISPVETQHLALLIIKAIIR
jgi:hypothetical protein